MNYRSVNGGGIAEGTKTLGTIKVDTVAPTLTSKAVNRTAVAGATDAGSGVAALEYSTDAGATWQGYTAALNAGNKAAAVLFRAADVAGNAAAEQEVKFAAVAVPSETGKPSASATPSVTATATTATAGSSQQAAATQDAQASGELASTGAGDSLAWTLRGGLMLVLGGLVLRLRKSASA